MAEYLLAIDQGTTASSASLMELKKDGRLCEVAEASAEFPQYFPKPGWVEHDLEELWQSVVRAVRSVLRKGKKGQIIAVGLTNQRETLCLWDRKTGNPLHRAIVWQDRRSSDDCEALKKKGLDSYFQKKTGLLLDPYFTATKLAWALRNISAVKRAHRLGRLAVGTVDSYLLYRLTGQHFTEPSNASRTLAYHLKGGFDQELCDFLKVPLEVWPEVKPSMGFFGTIRGLKELEGIPVTGVLGDQQSALLGQRCIAPGSAKCTYGTGAFLLVNTGSKPVLSQQRLLTSIAWNWKGKTTYALEGSSFIAGAAVQWLRDGLGLIRRADEIEALARKVSSSEGVSFVPALTGLGAPHWESDATGLLTGVTRGTRAPHIARAVLEGIAFQTADLVWAMEKDLGRKLPSLNVDGGASENALLMQFQADLLGISLFRPPSLETTLLGAIFAAGLGAGVWEEFSDIEKHKKATLFQPKMTSQAKKAALARWNQALRKVKCR